MLEGIGREVDRHRGMRGAFNAVLEGYANCEAAGLAAEIRTPLTRWNYPELADILDLVESWGESAGGFLPPCLRGPGQQSAG